MVFRPPARIGIGARQCSRALKEDGGLLISKRQPSSFENVALNPAPRGLLLFLGNRVERFPKFVELEIFPIPFIATPALLPDSHEPLVQRR